MKVQIMEAQHVSCECMCRWGRACSCIRYVKNCEELYSLFLRPHWLFMFSISLLHHTCTDTLLSILPVHPSLSIILLSTELPEKWLSFKWPTQHGKITRLSSRSARCVDIAYAHKNSNTPLRICARLCICIPQTHVHIHALLALAYVRLFCIHTQ